MNVLSFTFPIEKNTPAPLRRYRSTFAKVQEHLSGGTEEASKGSRPRCLWRWLMLLMVVLLPCCHCLAQGFSYHPLPTQQQLPAANVNVVMQDSEGYMWYGTAGGGICMDDGYKVFAYNSETTGKGVMENDEVTCMAEDHHGKIWFGTRGGTYYINKKDRTVHRVENKYTTSRKVNCISVTPDGCVWVGIEQDVLKFSQEGQFLKALSIGTNKRQEVKEMIVDSKGTLWMTILRGGLVTINPQTDQMTTQPWDFPAAASYMVEDTLRHYYWVGTWGGGIVRYPDMTVEPATVITTEKQHFGSEVYNLWIDPQRPVMWTATMDDIYAYTMQAPHSTSPVSSPSPMLQPYDISQVLPKGKKLINKLFADKRGNIWVPGYSPHTFILTPTHSGDHIRRDEVQAMTDQMGYKVMVNRIACEGDYDWIYQNRTRLSLYHPATGQLSFMATDAYPTPLSTQKALARCKTKAGVWTCNGKKLIHVWHEGMKILWEEEEEAKLPNYISALSDEGNGKLLIGTEKQAFLYNYNTKKLKQLTDTVGIIQQISYDQKGKLTYTIDPQAPKQLADTHGHVWTLTELTLTEHNPKTGASRTLHASDPNINMDYLTDITLSDDSICLGGIGAYCMIGSCHELDEVRPDGPIMVSHYDSLQSISVSTMNHLHAANIQFAYRIHPKDPWTELPKGENTIDISHLQHGTYTLQVKATDEFGVWHTPQSVYTFSVPYPWYLRWYAWSVYAAILGALIVFLWKYRQLKTHPGESPLPSATPVPYNKEHPFFIKVTELVEKNIDNSNYNVEDLCRDLGMSRMNMYRKFQSLSTITPLEFIRIYRLNKGATLLQTSDLSINEIAYAVGFSSAQYFAKCFKEVFQLTPRQYREREKKDIPAPHGAGIIR